MIAVEDNAETSGVPADVEGEGEVPDEADHLPEVGVRYGVRHVQGEHQVQHLPFAFWDTQMTI